MGCGVLFSSAGEAETAFFTRNGVLFGWVPLPGGSAPLVYPIVGSLGGGGVAIDLKASFAARPACTLFAASGSKTEYSNLKVALGQVASDQDVVRLEKGVHAFASSVSVVKGVTIATAETDGAGGVARVESAEPPTPALSFTSSTRNVGKKKVEASSSSLLSLQVLEGPWALSCVIQESMSLKYEPTSKVELRAMTGVIWCFGALYLHSHLLCLAPHLEIDIH